MKLLPREQSIHYACVFYLMILGLAMTRVQNLIFKNAGRNGTWLILLCALLFLGCTWLYTTVAKSSNGATVLDSAGKFLAPVLYLLFALYFWGVSLFSDIVAGDYFSRTIVIDDSIRVIILSIIINAVASLFPIATLARYGHVVLFFILPIFLLIFVTPLKVVDWGWAQPMFNTKEWGSPWEAISACAILFTPLALYPYLRAKSDTMSYRSVTAWTLSGGLFASYILFLGYTIFGPNTAKEMVFLPQETVNAVRIEYMFFERILFIVILLWKYLQLLASALLLRCSAWSIAQILHIQRLRWIVLTMTGLSIVGVYNLRIPFMLLKMTVWLGYFGLMLMTMVPILLFLGFLLKNRRKRGHG